MSIIVLEQTPCSLCGEPIQRGDETVSFPPFVANRNDPIYRFSDGAFHRRCFVVDPLARAAAQRCDDVRRRGGGPGSRCGACGKSIADPDDYFGTGFLTDDAASPVYEFNYLHLHLSHFLEWARARDFRMHMEKFLDSSKWDGPTLKFDPLPMWVAPSR